MPLRSRRSFLLIVLLLLAAVMPQAAAQKNRAERHVILISLDGFGAYNWDDARLPLPNLRRLAAEGARADRMTVVTPSVTWPNHTTLVTGVSPARHGVLANGEIEPSTGSDRPLIVNPRRSKEELCKAPTLYDLAHRAGLRTAEVNWPVTRGAASLDWSFPDHPDPLRYTTPSLLQELQVEKILTQPTDPAFSAAGALMRDHIWTQTAVHLLKRHKPHLLLLHLLLTDGTQHQYGPSTPEALAALSLADRQVGDVLQAVRDAGLGSTTTVFVVADHGFIKVEKQIRPNAALRRAGLIHPAAGDERKLEWEAQAIPEGGLALVYVPNGALRPEVVERTRKALAGLEGVERVLSPAEFGPLGLPVPPRNPQAPYLVLSAKDGYAFTADVTEGPDVVELPKPTGTHGYVHTNPKMDALFVAGGTGIRKGARLERIRNVDVAPTIAHLLALSLEAEGKVLEEILQ